MTLAYLYSKRCEVSDLSRLKCGYWILIGSDSPDARKTHFIFQIKGEGANQWSSRMRRLVWMQGTHISVYLLDAIGSNNS